MNKNKTNVYDKMQINRDRAKNWAKNFYCGCVNKNHCASNAFISIHHQKMA